MQPRSLDSPLCLGGAMVAVCAHAQQRRVGVGCPGARHRVVAPGATACRREPPGLFEGGKAADASGARGGAQGRRAVVRLG